MVTINTIIEDIKADLSSYSESGLIDEISLEMHLMNKLKGFGGNVMETYPKVLEIKNSQARLPKNFFSLYKAVKTEPIGYYNSDTSAEDALIHQTFFRIRKEASSTWDNMSNSYKEGCYKEVTESVYLDIPKANVDFYYGNHTPLKLVEGFDKSKLNLKCENIHIKKSPHQINIIRDTLQTNFSKGFVCIWYQGLMTNEDDQIILPEDPNAHIYQYLIASGKAKVFELLWANNDDPNVGQKLQFYKQEEARTFTEASYQARMKTVSGGNWWHGLKNQQRKRIRVFENFGN